MGDGKELVGSSDKTLECRMSPYYLAPSDNPGTSITHVILSGENYAEWALELENALRKIRFVNGSLKIPDEKEKPVEAEMWRTVNSMIVGWIRASISPVIRSTVPFSPDACKMWSDLKKRFSVGSAVRVHQIKVELASCKKQGSSVMDYFGKLSQKWEELLNFKPIPTCTCEAGEIYAKEYEAEKVHQFLMGLDDSRFSNVVTNIIGMEPLPDLNSAYQRVIREEKRLGSACLESKEAPVEFFMKRVERKVDDQAMMVAVTRGRASVVCSNCGRTGHEKKECWQLIGFPEWFTERSQQSSRGGRGRSNSPRANVVQAQPCLSGSSSGNQGSSVPQLTAEQWASLTSLLERQKPSPRVAGKTALGKKNEETTSGVQQEDGIYCAQTTATTSVSVVAISDDNGVSTNVVEGMADCEDAEAGSPRRIVESGAVSEEDVNKTPHRADSGNEYDGEEDESESEHPGEISISNKLRIFLTT